MGRAGEKSGPSPAALVRKEGSGKEEEAFRLPGLTVTERGPRTFSTLPGWPPRTGGLRVGLLHKWSGLPLQPLPFAEGRNLVMVGHAGFHQLVQHTELQLVQADRYAVFRREMPVIGVG